MNPAVRDPSIELVSGTRTRLLLISYWYPPAVGAAAERMHSFAKYLPTHGWDVRVLTARHHDSTSQDDPSVTYVRDPWRRREGAIADYDPRKTANWKQRLRGLLRDCIFPDRFRRWQQDAYHQALTLIRDWKPDLLLVSFPPASAVDLALRLHDATGVPFVLDYRDKWLGPGGYEPIRTATTRRHMELEKRAVAASAAVTAVSDALIAHLRDDLAASRDRSVVIYNGFEQSAIPTIAGPRETGLPFPRFIAHVGTVIERNRPDLFFQSLGELLARFWGEDDRPADPIPFEGFRFRFVGNLSAQYLIDARLNEWVATMGLVPRATAREEMLKADALLLLTGNYVAKWGYSVKLFEYLQTGRPILCLEQSPDSNDARLLRELAPERSFIGRLGETASLTEQLAALRNYLAHPPASSPTHDKLLQFDRKIQAAKLADFLGRIPNR